MAVFGIGIVGVALGDTDPIDLDGNGASDSFTACKTIEGFNFAVWRGEPRAGEPLWKAFYNTADGFREETDCASDPELERARAPAEWPFSARIGWVDTCLAIKNDALEPGTPVTVLMFESDENVSSERILKRRAEGKILGKTTSAANCPPLIEDRRTANEDDGASFYAVAFDGGTPEDGIFGIAVVGPEPEELERIDLNGDGAADNFTACASLEGIHFTAWGGEPHEDRPLWEAYYSLGYGTEGDDCPLSFSNSRPAGPPELWSPEARVGWVHGGCLGIYNTILQPGTPVTIAIFGADERTDGKNILGRRAAAKIDGRTDSGADCPNLAESVRDWNTSSDIAYYKVAVEDGRSFEPEALGIAIVGPASADAPIDLDENARPDSFSLCGTDDSIVYTAWPGTANTGDPLWPGFSYLGHKPKGVLNCP